MADNEIEIYGKFVSRVIGGALLDDYSVIGSYHTVNTIADRNNIAEQVRKAGMAVYVTEIGSLYILGTDLSNESWILFTPFEDLSLTIVAETNLDINTISLISNNDNETEFDNKQAVFIIKSDADNSIVRLYGNVNPINLPSNSNFGDKIYIDETGNLSTNMIVTNTTYKQIGNIVKDNNGNLVLALISDQTNYKIR